MRRSSTPFAPRRRSPAERREQLVAAARRVFVKKGYDCASVSDIVKAAGVAQGTFYLYFKEKNDVLNAVAMQAGDSIADAVELAVTSAGPGAAAKLLALRDVVLDAANEPMAQSLARFYHRPQNRAHHERMTEQISSRLVPLLENVVRQGVAEGVFDVEDPRAAAWFVLGGLHALESGFADPADYATAVAGSMGLVFRALGRHVPSRPRRRRTGG